MSAPDTQNDYMLAGGTDSIDPLLPIHITTRQQAYRTAAWLVAMAQILEDDGSFHTFEEIQAAVDNT